MLKFNSKKLLETTSISNTYKFYKMRKLLLFTAMVIAALSSYCQNAVTCDDATIHANTTSNTVCFELLESDKIRACFSNNYPDGATSISFGAGGVAGHFIGAYRTNKIAVYHRAPRVFGCYTPKAW